MSILKGKIIAVILSVIFILTSLYVVTFNGSSSNSYKNFSYSSPVSFAQNSAIKPGYVEYTLDLLNNTLIPGNFQNTTNTFGDSCLIYDSDNGNIYVTGAGSNNVLIINASTNAVEGSISVGSYPKAMTLDKSTGNLYVVDEGSRSVSVVNTVSNKLTTSIRVGVAPYAITCDPFNEYLYVDNIGLNDLSVINGVTNKIIGNISLGSLPEDVITDTHSGFIYVSNARSNDVSVINETSNIVVKNISVGACPEGLAYDPNNNYIYVVNRGSLNVSVINASTNSVVKTVKVVYNFQYADFNPENSNIYLGECSGKTVSILNSSTNDIIKNITLSAGANGIAFNPFNEEMYLTSQLSNQIFVVNTTSYNVITSYCTGLIAVNDAYDSLNQNVYVGSDGTTGISVINGTHNYIVGRIPGKILTCSGKLVIDSVSGCIYASHYASNYISAINGTTNTYIRNITVGQESDCGIAYDDSNGNLYISNLQSNSVSVVNATSDSLIKSIPVGLEPSSISYDRINDYLYVGNYVSNSISVINTANNSVVDNFSLGGHPRSIAIGPSNNYLYVAINNNISVLNAINGTFIKNITVGNAAYCIAYDTSNGYFYVTNSKSNNISIISASTNTVIDNVSVGICPIGITYDSENNLIYVVNLGSGTVSLLASNALTQQSNGGSGYVKYTLDLATNQLMSGNVKVNSALLNAFGEVSDSANGNLYLTTGGTQGGANDSVLVVNDSTNTIIKYIQVGYGETGIAFDSSNDCIYAINDASYNISVINGTTNKLVGNITDTSGAGLYNAIAYDPYNGYLYISSGNTNGGTSPSVVSVVNPINGTVIANIQVGKDAYGIAYDPSNHNIYVTNRGSSNISVIGSSTNSVISSIPVQGGPISIVYDPSDSNLYVSYAGSGSSDLTVISGLNNTVIGTIEMGSLNHYGIAYDSANKYIYVSDANSGNITVINVSSFKIAANISLNQSEPYTVLFDPANNFVYVTNYKYSSLSIISTSQLTSTKQNNTKYNVTFLEHGLPSNVNWYVNLTDGLRSGPISNSSYSFLLINGSYAYTISNVSGYLPTTPAGIFNVDGQNFTIDVSFNATHTNKPPSWAFIGSYVNYSLTEKNNISTEQGYLFFKILEIDNTTETMNVKSVEYNSSSTESSYYNYSWNDAPFAFNSTDLSMLNNGTVPNSMSEMTVTDNVDISTSLGSYTTDELSYTPGSSQFEKLYVDNQTGVIVSILYSNKTSIISANISSTNIPTMLLKTKKISPFPSLEVYEIAGVAVIVLSIVAVAVLRRKK